MQANASIRPSLGLSFLVAFLALAGCGTGEGPTPIPGTPAPPRPPVTCDTINFEDGCGPFSFSDFAGGRAAVVRNPAADGVNGTESVARMVKDGGEVYGGSTLETPEAIVFAQGEAFKMKVWSRRAVPVLFKLEGPDPLSQDDDRERSASHSGSGGWEELCFDFAGDTPPGNSSNAITFIFDPQVVGDATNDPDGWTFYFDEIEQVDSCPVPPPLFPVDFEGDPASYNFGAEGGFGGGASDVVANPDQSGANTSAQVARMQKFAGEVYGGSTLSLGRSIDFAQGSAFRMKVRASRVVPVLFKLEGPNPDAQDDDREVELDYGGSGGWEEMCFDFTGNTAGLSSSAITFIFDLGTSGDAQNNPDAWTFYFDDIEQVASCGGAAPGTLLPVDFEDDPASYDFGPGADGGFDGGQSDVVANPDQSGINTSAQVARMQKFAGEVYGGSTLPLGEDIDFTQGEAFTLKVRASRAVPVLFKLEGPDPAAQDDDREIELDYGGSGGWEELCFDFTGNTAGLASRAITFIFDLGTAGDAQNNPDAWTFYFDDIEQVASCGGEAPLGPVDFEPDGLGQAFTWNVFENGDNPAVAVLANPDASGANTSATVAQFTARQAGQTFAGAITSDLPTFTLDSSNSCVRIKVWKPVISDVGIKFETATQASTGEIRVANTVTNQWEQLTFDFSGKIGEPESTDITGFVLFPDFAARTQDNVIYFDDIEFLDADQCAGGGGGGGDVPTSVDFEGDAASYDFGPDGGFDGGVSTIVANPDQSGINTSAQVVQMQKFAGQPWGGSTLAVPAGVDWSQGETFTMKVWSPRSVPVLFKLETNVAERDDRHDGESQWQELCFDFTGTVAGQAITGFTVIFDLGQVGDAANDPDNWTFYYDDIQQTTGGCPAEPEPEPTFETITFDDPDTTYTLVDFGGNLSAVTNDPAGGTNQVVQVVKSGAAELWAGTTVATLPGDAVPQIPLTAASTRMSVRVYSPDAGIPVRLKIEDASDNTISVETEATTTVANDWETLVFDFANEAPGTAPFNEANTYDKVSIFFNFGTTGAEAGEKTYYFDDIGLAAEEPATSFATITFDDPGITYTLADFGGNASAVTDDPVGGTNQVVQVVKSGAAELWAGTTVGTLPGDAVPQIPLTAASTRMSVRVYSPDAGIPVRLKVEDASDPTISVETEATTAAANAWETLVFDFANQAPGTAAFNEANTYDKVSIFFNFGTTGAEAGEKTYYFDDIGVAP